MLAWLVLASSIASLSGSVAWAAEEVRHSGTVHSFTPSDGVLLIDARGVDGAEEIVWADVRAADVVRLSRHPRRPWEWRERQTAVHWLSVGTYITVIGREDRVGILRVRRVEVPRLDDVQ